MSNKKLGQVGFSISFNKSEFEIDFRVNLLLVKEEYGDIDVREQLTVTDERNSQNWIRIEQVKTKGRKDRYAFTSNLEDPIMLYDMYGMAFSAIRTIYNDGESDLYHGLMLFKSGDKRGRRGRHKFSEKHVTFRLLRVNNVTVSASVTNPDGQWDSFSMKGFTKEEASYLCREAEERLAKILNGLGPLIQREVPKLS